MQMDGRYEILMVWYIFPIDRPLAPESVLNKKLKNTAN